MPCSTNGLTRWYWLLVSVSAWQRCWERCVSYGWSLKPMIYASLVPVLTLTVYSAIDPQMEKTIGLAWDCGAVTTGPVTVPLMLSLGIGIAAAAGKGDSGLSGFGIVTLASLFPITGVLLLALYVSFTQSPSEIIELAQTMRLTLCSITCMKQRVLAIFTVAFSCRPRAS
jgi:hypothetical protein